MTVKDQNGKTVFSEKKEFSENLFVVEGKEDMMIAEWNVFAQELVDLSLHGGGYTKTETFIIHLPEGATSADVEASFIYEYEPGETATVQKVVKKVNFPKQ